MGNVAVLMSAGGANTVEIAEAAAATNNYWGTIATSYGIGSTPTTEALDLQWSKAQTTRLMSEESISTIFGGMNGEY